MDNMKTLFGLNDQLKEFVSLNEQYELKKELLDSKQKELSFLKTKIDSLDKRVIREENRKYEREIKRRKDALLLFLVTLFTTFLCGTIIIGLVYLNPFMIYLKNILWFITGSFLVSGGNYIVQLNQEKRRVKINYIDLNQQKITIYQQIKELEKEIVSIKSNLFSIEDKRKKVEAQNNYMLNYQNNIENNYIESNKFHR